ncbi:MAG: PASTA domain-containing protein, partial [Gemmiger sp.]
TEEYSSEVEKGRVIEQEPLANSLVTEENEIIRIVVSRGPNLVEMPNIIGFTQENASALLDKKGIVYSMLMLENDGSYAAGCVAKCDVAAGTLIDTGKTVVNVFIAGERDDSKVAQTGSGNAPSEDSVG